MGTLNDEILRATGGPTVNDGLMAYYLANGATGGALEDRERQFLAATSIIRGPNLVVDGAFDSPSDWVAGAGWSVAGGLGVAVSSPGGQALDSAAALGLTVGLKYELIFDVAGYVGGGVIPKIGSASGTSRAANGTFIESITAVDDGVMSFESNFTTTLNIDNASLREVIESAKQAGWTNQDGWMQYLNSLGYEGTLNDRLLQFWTAQ